MLFDLITMETLEEMSFVLDAFYLFISSFLGEALSIMTIIFIRIILHFPYSHTGGMEAKL